MTASFTVEAVALDRLAASFGELAAARDVDEILSRATGCAQQALGTGVKALTIAVPKGRGRLRVVAARTPAGGDRGRAVPRRLAFRSGTTVAVGLGDRRGSAVAAVPLRAHEGLIGVIEFVGPRVPVIERTSVLEAIAAQAGVVMASLAIGPNAASNDLRAARDVLRFAGDLVETADQELALRRTVRFVHERFRAPSAAWIRTDGVDGVFTLVAARGIPRDRRRELVAIPQAMPAWPEEVEAETEVAAVRFAATAGTGSVETIILPRAVVMVSGWDTASDGLLELIRGALIASSRRHSAVDRVARWNEQLDLSLALTAHEIRAPLLGARAAIESVRDGEGWGADRLVVLERTHRELGDLASMTDGILRWAAGGAALPTRRVDLTAVAEAAVALCGPGAAERVRLVAARPASAVVATTQVRVAVANLIRNALAYAPPRTDVTVDVTEDEMWATISVRDRGPGISPEERESIFDPFVRGNGQRGRGSGLGLFVARRVVEGHGGEIDVETSDAGATFYLRFPVATRRQPSAS